jgi:hypothetical protein
MGTRGFIGFVANDHESITYNHWDSYPEALGVTMLSFARAIEDRAAVKRSAAELVHVSDDAPPTDEQIEALARFTNRSVGELKDRPEWYQVLRKTQGDPAMVLAAGYVEHNPEWPVDSLFCEWGYLLDLDREVLEVYEGFQTSAHAEGRFHDRGRRDGYFPVRLVATYPLDALPSEEAFLAALGDDDDE